MKRMPPRRRQLDEQRIHRVSLSRHVVLELHVCAGDRARLVPCVRRRPACATWCLTANSQCSGLRPCEVEEVVADLAAQVAIDRDQSLGVLGEQLAIDARLVVEARAIRLGAEDQQVLPPDVVHREQDEVEAALATACIGAIGGAACRAE